jgi:acetylornithine deacetylase/succinyl-diaminopimelate desuccinylase-like protein
VNRPTIIKPTHQESLWHRFQRAAIEYLRALPSSAPIAVPAALGDAIRGTARAGFGTRRFTFAQLLNVTFTMPDLAWWYGPDTLPQAVETIIVPPDDQALFAHRTPAAQSGEQVAALITEALRQTGEWHIEVTPPTMHSSERLVFQRRSTR